MYASAPGLSDTVHSPGISGEISWMSSLGSVEILLSVVVCVLLFEYQVLVCITWYLVLCLPSVNTQHELQH